MNLLWFASEEDSVSDFFKEVREREILVFTLFVNLSFQIKIISKAIYILAHEWSVRFRENDVRPRHSKRDWETLAHILFSSAEVSIPANGVSQRKLPFTSFRAFRRDRQSARMIVMVVAGKKELKHNNNNNREKEKRLMLKSKRDITSASQNPATAEAEVEVVPRTW